MSMYEDAKTKYERALEGISNLESRLTFRLAILSRLLDRQVTRILSNHDLTLASYRVLVIVNAFGEISAAELARYGAVDKGLVSRRAADLERDGLIETKAKSSKGKRKLLTITQKGKDRLIALKPEIDARQDGLLGQMSEEEHKTLFKVVDKLTLHILEKLEETGDSSGG